MILVEKSRWSKEQSFQISLNP